MLTKKQDEVKAQRICERCGGSIGGDGSGFTRCDKSYCGADLCLDCKEPHMREVHNE